MNRPENITCFYQAVIHILGQLYEQFPEREAMLDAKQWQVDSPISDSCKKDFGLRRNLYSETLHWLIDEGFIRCDESNGQFRNVRLSSKGLSVLNVVPEDEMGRPAEERRPIGRILAEGVAKGLANTLGTKAAMALCDYVPQLIEMVYKRASA